jgi:hypothetical protein
MCSLRYILFWFECFARSTAETEEDEKFVKIYDLKVVGGATSPQKYCAHCF